MNEPRKPVVGVTEMKSKDNHCLSNGVQGCQFIKKDGSLCKAHTIKDSDFCFFHTNADNAKAAGKKGGKKGRCKVLFASNLSLKSTKEVTQLLERTIKEVRRGDLDRGIANCVGYLAGILLKCLEQSELEKRIEKIEEAVFKT